MSKTYSEIIRAQALHSLLDDDVPTGFAALLTNAEHSLMLMGGELRSRQTIAVLWELYKFIRDGEALDVYTGRKIE